MGFFESFEKEQRERSALDRCARLATLDEKLKEKEFRQKMRQLQNEELIE